MLPRITGTEMEYGLLIQPEAGSDFGCPDNYTDSIIQRYSPLQQRIGRFCDNGSRFYGDVGDHVEYATPEDTSLEGTVANEIAGERIVYASYENARLDGKFYNFDLNKRLVDDLGNTWGHHENFLVPRAKIEVDDESLALLGLHLATVNLLTGAGAVIVDPKGNGRFVIAQKALDLEQDFFNGTTRCKPLVNLRDEPHAAPDKWARVHVTSGDANMSPWAMAMRLGTISLVLHLSEQRHKLNHLLLEQPLYRVGIQVATDLSMKKTVRLTNSKSIHPLQIQTELMGAVQKVSKEIEFSDEELWVLSEWEQACDDLRTNPELLADRTDWVAKAQFLEKFRQRHNLTWGSQEIRDMDKLWGNLAPYGIGQRLRQGIWAQWMPDEELIADREINPPPTTRANIRGMFIKRFARVAYEVSADWSHVKHDTKTISLKDPYATRHDAVDKLLRVA